MSGKKIGGEFVLIGDTPLHPHPRALPGDLRAQWPLGGKVIGEKLGKKFIWGLWTPPFLSPPASLPGSLR